MPSLIGQLHARSHTSGSYLVEPLLDSFSQELPSHTCRCSLGSWPSCKTPTGVSLTTTTCCANRCTVSQSHCLASSIWADLLATDNVDDHHSGACQQQQKRLENAKFREGTVLCSQQQRLFPACSSLWLSGRLRKYHIVQQTSRNYGTRSMQIRACLHVNKN